MEELTQEQIHKSINAEFDSVNLINREIQLPLTEERTNLVVRNYVHLEIMLTKVWFSEALTTEQRTAIDQSIQDSLTYLGR
jgi:hypothetical protein